MSQHTPGPWWIDDDGFIAYSGDDYKTIADPRCMPPQGNEAEIDANARLIAAAPELLSALNNARGWLDELCGHIQAGNFQAAQDWVGANAVSTDSTLREIVAKAEGRAE